jgi:hypothetical protein
MAIPMWGPSWSYIGRKYSAANFKKKIIIISGAIKIYIPSY